MQMKIKYPIALLAFLTTGMQALACPVCERQQPKLLKGITHGAGPQTNWDYLIISIAAAIVLVTLFLSVKWLLRPGEKSKTHIKYSVLNFDNHGQ
jgi:hypothetical protein